MAYFSVLKPNESEKVIEKSRFLSYCRHVESEEEARAFLEELRALHPLATHICYGYIADKTGNFMRFSDAGEPQGTAGMPILGVIKAKKLYETAVAVVRYFGGIKLGAGGLTRAYAAGAQEVLSSAEICEYDKCAELKLFVDYASVDVLQRFLSVPVVRREFDMDAQFVVLVRESEEEGFIASVNNLLCGKVKIEKSGERYAPLE